MTVAATLALRGAAAPPRDGALVAAVRTRVLAELAPTAPVCGEAVARLVRQEAPLLDDVRTAAVVQRVLQDVVGLGPLEPLLADPSVTEIMVNGPGRLWVERAGRLERVDAELDEAAISHLIEKILAPLGLRVDRAAPLVDARLPDGSRVNAVVPPFAVDGPYLTIRRFRTRAFVLDDFCLPPAAALLRWAVAARLNIVVSGGTGSGKTALLNALATAVPVGERIVTVEDAAELRLPQPHVVRLEARPANAEGAGEVTIRQLVRNALRMRPDRIVVGEVRGGEAFDMLQAMNTGHDGSLSTCHANTAEDALRRIESLALLAGVGLPLEALRDHVEAAVDLVVHVVRTGAGCRAVGEIAEVVRSGGGAEGRGRLRRLANAGEVCALPTRPARAVGVPPPGEAA